MTQTAWTNPKTWTAGEVPDNTGMNTYLRDNQGYLFSPGFVMKVTGSANEISASASTAVPIHASLSATAVSYGRDIRAHFQGVFGGGRVQLNLLVDNTAWTDRVSGIVRNQVDQTNETLQYDVWVTGLATGTAHTFVPVWYSTGNYITLRWSATPAVFWVREG